MKQTIKAGQLIVGDKVFREGVCVGRTVNSVVDTGNSVEVQYFGRKAEYNYEHPLVVERSNEH